MSNTVAHDFFSDPRIAQAKKLLRETLTEYQKKIDGPKEGDANLKKQYEELLQKFGDNRGGKLFYPYIGSGLGKGPLVELADGSTKYDFITGIGVHYFGHSHPDLMEAQVDAALANTPMQGHLQQNVDSTHFVQLLLDQVNKYGGNFAHCFMTSSGVMAVENALKICFQKRAPATRVLAFEKCFAGRTLAVAQITDKPAYRDGLPDTLRVDYIPFYDYRDHAGSIERTTTALKKHLARNPGKHAAIVMELIQGEAGSWPGHEEFFKNIIDVCHQHNISIIVDEVQSFARTSELFTTQYFKLDKLVDVITVGKNSQVCATLFREDHRPRPGLIAQTFTSSTAALSSGLAIIEEIVKGDFLGEKGKINQLHNIFEKELEKVAKKYPDKLQGPYGIGAMVAMTVHGGDMEKSKQFTIDLFKNGVMSFIAGSNPTRVRFLIPIPVIEEEDIKKVASIIEQTLKQG